MPRQTLPQDDLEQSLQGLDAGLGKVTTLAVLG